MNVISTIVVCLVPLFLVFFYISCKFSFSNEAKTENGKQVLLKSYQHSIAVFPIGWLIIEGFYRYAGNISYEMYRDYMVGLILLLFIIQGFSIAINRKKYNHMPQKTI